MDTYHDLANELNVCTHILGDLPSTGSCELTAHNQPCEEFYPYRVASQSHGLRFTHQEKVRAQLARSRSRPGAMNAETCGDRTHDLTLTTRPANHDTKKVFIPHDIYIYGSGRLIPKNHVIGCGIWVGGIVPTRLGCYRKLAQQIRWPGPARPGPGLAEPSLSQAELR